MAVTGVVRISRRPLAHGGQLHCASVHQSIDEHNVPERVKSGEIGPDRGRDLSASKVDAKRGKKRGRSPLPLQQPAFSKANGVGPGHDEVIENSNVN